jgi:hypothetical protein
MTTTVGALAALIPNEGSVKVQQRNGFTVVEHDVLEADVVVAHHLASQWR